MAKGFSIVYLLLIFTSILIVDLSCSKSLKTVAGNSQTDSLQSDTAEYELLVFNTDYESWLMTHGKNIDFHSKSHYELRNAMYVSLWNANYMSNPTGPFHFYIEYNTNEDYDKELEYRLYYYFKYVEDLYNIKIR